ncbi:MAG: hypothetical protein QM747_07515 [Nocardioides sp.]
MGVHVGGAVEAVERGAEVLDRDLVQVLGQARCPEVGQSEGRVARGSQGGRSLGGEVQAALGTSEDEDRRRIATGMDRLEQLAVQPAVARSEGVNGHETILQRGLANDGVRGHHRAARAAVQK